jgi:hypothetical protein
MFKPTLESALAGLNKATATLLSVSQRKETEAELADKEMEDAKERRNAALNEASHARAVAERITALTAP